MISTNIITENFDDINLEEGKFGEQVNLSTLVKILEENKNGI